MARKTAGVELLVRDVLATIPEPYSEDITLELCQAIEVNPEFRRRYNELSEELRGWLVNNFIGKYTKQITGRRSGQQVDTKACDLITSYTKLYPQI